MGVSWGRQTVVADTRTRTRTRTEFSFLLQSGPGSQMLDRTIPWTNHYQGKTNTLYALSGRWRFIRRIALYPSFEQLGPGRPGF